MKSIGSNVNAFAICALAALASCGPNNGAVPNVNADSAATGQAARYRERVLWSFTSRGGVGPAYPHANLLAGNDGSLYGTTLISSTHFNDGGNAFKLTRSGSVFTESLIYNFGGGSDGEHPGAGFISDKYGALYGTTEEGGGVAACSVGCGTVFKLTPSGSQYTESVLYRFANTPDGAAPYAPLIFDDKGALYGTTLQGGASGYGTVFKLTRHRSGYAETILHSFSGGSDGVNPYAGVIFDKRGALYGTTAGGGSYGLGTVFKLTPTGSGYSESIVHRFGAHGDGSTPDAGVVLDKKGALYGTTAAGGYYGFGAVFKLTPEPSGNLDKILLSFAGKKDGEAPRAALILDKTGALYGTASAGGRYGFGTVFELAPSGSGSSEVYAERVLHTFHFDDGASPEACLTFGRNGSLFGTTSNGGAGGYNGVGTAFELRP